MLRYYLTCRLGRRSMQGMSTSQTTQNFPVGCRVLHRMEGYEGSVTAHRGGRYPIVVRWDLHGPNGMSDGFRAACIASYRPTQLLRVPR
jgi:hypothetical protein